MNTLGTYNIFFVNSLSQQQQDYISIQVHFRAILNKESILVENWYASLRGNVYSHFEQTWKDDIFSQPWSQRAWTFVRCHNGSDEYRFSSRKAEDGKKKRKLSWVDVMMNMRQVSAFKEDKKRVKKKLDVLQHEFTTTEEFSEIKNKWPAWQTNVVSTRASPYLKIRWH